MGAVTKYFSDLYSGLATALVGMATSGRNAFRKPVTLEYPDERWNIPERYRGVLRNKIVDYIRKAVREDIVEDAESHEMVDSFWFKHSGLPTRDPAPWQFDPNAGCERKEFWGVLEQCLAKLKGKMRDAFVMKMLEERDSDEVCKILDVSPNNLWVLTHRARGQLKTCLEKHWQAAPK